MRAVFPKTIETLRGRLEDARSKRVVFLSHCLLNENPRYMGGACCAGANAEVLRFISRLDAGIIQMPCPERVSWGGVYKKHIYQFHGIGRIPGMHRICGFLMPLFMPLINWRMRSIARQTANEIQDYVSNGMEVLGVIGICGSPTCGVTCHPDLRRYFDWSSRIELKSITAAEQNAILAEVATKGPGVYVTLLRRALKRRGLDVPFYEFDLYDELEGKPNSGLMRVEELIGSRRAETARPVVAP